MSLGENHIKMVELIKNKCIGWEYDFAKNIEKQGWCSDKQLKILHDISGRIEYLKYNKDGINRNRSSYGCELCDSSDIGELPCYEDFC